MQKSISRRDAIAGAGAVAGAAAVVAAPAAIAGSAARTEIEALFAEWLVAANGPQDPSEDDNWGASRYVRLQARIVAAEPRTPRDMAIQFYVDTDQFASDWSSRLESLVELLVGPVA